MTDTPSNAPPATRRSLLRAMGAAALYTGLAARAQSYPQRPIKLVVPWPAGAITDVLARRLAEPVGADLGQPLVVDNRPGAGGSLGAGYVAHAPADGHTVLVASSDTHALNPSYYKRLPYSIDAFADVMGLARFSYVLAVGPNVPAGSLAQFIALARSGERRLSYASWGNGSLAHLGTELFKAAAGAEMLHVPFLGAAPALTALISGTVDFMIVPVGMAEPNRKAAKLRILALAGPARYPVIADVPTTAEAGQPSVIVQQWFGLSVPRATPAPAVERLHAAFIKALSTQDMADWLVSQGGEPMVLDGARFKAFAARESVRWRSVLRDAAIQLQ